MQKLILFNLIFIPFLILFLIQNVEATIVDLDYIKDLEDLSGEDGDDDFAIQMKWDISPIPSGATVTRAEIILYSHTCWYVILFLQMDI